MAKLTKKSYVRKKVVAAVCIFLAIALITTGLACWLLLSDASFGGEGNVNVATVVSSPMSFNEVKLNNGEKSAGGVEGAHIVFAPAQYDEDGRVKWDGPNSDYEALTVNVTGSVVNAQFLGKLYYTLTLPQGVIDAAAKGYLDISEFYDSSTGRLIPQIISYTSNDIRTGSDGISVLDFAFSFTIKWGEAFNGENPSLYFDTEYFLDDGTLNTSAGLWCTTEELTQTLDDFYSTVSMNEAQMHKFTITITAEVS